MVSKTPEPQVLFLNFGESSLDFELRVWVLDTDQRLLAKSELHQEIDRRFREANIEIAFPQRDLHLRSVDESVRMVPHAAPSA
jgi:small-conductance mechanosensitive channel